MSESTHEPAFFADFGSFDGRIWLNAAHQGPLPLVAIEAAHQALAWKAAPHRLSPDAFSEVPARLKHALARLIGAPAEEIVLGNSASYGLHLLANGIRWREGDEVIVPVGDFPATILPWLALRRRGVVVHQVRPREQVLSVHDVEAYLTDRTRLVATSWVNSFSGYAVDLAAVGALCRAAGVLFAVNASQATGARPLDVSVTPVDAITSCGFKWLCGPYGTGFCWMRSELLESLDYNQAYWLASEQARHIDRDVELRYNAQAKKSARTYDVFGTANFFNFMPWTAAVEYLLSVGIQTIAAHDDALVTRLVADLDFDKFDLLSPGRRPERSTLVVVTHGNADRNRQVYDDLRAAGIDVALPRAVLRFSPHLYNTMDDIERALEVLSEA